MESYRKKYKMGFWKQHDHILSHGKIAKLDRVQKGLIAMRNAYFTSLQLAYINDKR